MHKYKLFSNFFSQNLTECVKFLQFQWKITLDVCKSWSSTQIMREIALFSGKIYTAGTNFTRPWRLRQISTLTYLSTSPKMTIIKSSKCHCSSQSFSINRLSRSIFSCSLHTLLVICIYSYNPTRCPKNREVAI